MFVAKKGDIKGYVMESYDINQMVSETLEQFEE